MNEFESLFNLYDANDFNDIFSGSNDSAPESPSNIDISAESSIFQNNIMIGSAGSSSSSSTTTSNNNNNNQLSTSSSSSSLTLDFKNINADIFNNDHYHNHHQNMMNINNQNHHSINVWNENLTLIGVNHHIKHDVSCGPESSNESFFKTSHNLKLPITLIGRKLPEVKSNTICNASKISAYNNNNSNFIKKHSSDESFLLQERIQPKKTRTKYTKEQLSYLEKAFAQSPYPDTAISENLCKTLEISKDKINIWFQNRRARSKRNCTKIKNLEQSSHENSDQEKQASFNLSPPPSNYWSY